MLTQDARPDGDGDVLVVLGKLIAEPLVLVLQVGVVDLADFRPVPGLVFLLDDVIQEDVVTLLLSYLPCPLDLRVIWAS